jgi:5'-AMP-activated protein kinase catalytic alpha subunit
MTNILVDGRGKIKIVDFGFAAETKTLQKMYCGTPSYMAPEIVLKKVYDGRGVDIWSLGVVLFKLFTGKYVFGCKFPLSTPI